uniref:Uncharacterized protein n=1 Tax=Equus asinus TaxID=9793 RepID=A0A8C4M3F7_EQUAS
ARRAHPRPPEPVPRRPRRAPQGAALPLHPQGGLRGAHGQVRLLHYRHHRPQGDRLPLRGRELLERGHHSGAHRLPEPPRPGGLPQPPAARGDCRAARGPDRPRALSATRSYTLEESGRMRGGAGRSPGAPLHRGGPGGLPPTDHGEDGGRVPAPQREPSHADL